MSSKEEKVNEALLIVLLTVTIALPLVVTIAVFCFVEWSSRLYWWLKTIRTKKEDKLAVFREVVNAWGKDILIDEKLP